MDLWDGFTQGGAAFVSLVLGYYLPPLQGFGSASA